MMKPKSSSTGLSCHRAGRSRRASPQPSDPLMARGYSRGFLPYGDVGAAVAGEGLALPAAPPLAQGQPRDPGHQVELGRPQVTVRRGECLRLTVDNPVVMRDRDLRGDVALLEAQ